MSYTAKIIKAGKRNDKWNVTVEYADGAKVLQKSYNLDATLSAEKAASMLRAKLKELDDFEAATLPFPIGEVLDLTPPPPPPPPDPVEPTQAELDRVEWFDNYREMQQFNILIAIGVKDTNDVEIENMRVWLRDNYLPDYQESI